MALVVVQGSVPLPELIGFIKEHGVDVDSASITTDPAASSSTQHSQALLYVSRLDDATLRATAKQLKPGASVAVRVLGAQQDVGSMLLLNGFTDCQPSTSGAVTTVSARLPDFAAGAKDSIKLKPKQQQPAPAAAAAAKPSAGAWVLTGDDDGDDELVDDEELLTEADLQRPAPAAAQDDCEVGAGGARKACKNCSCGRAEAEARGEKVTLTQEMLDNPQSSCGNCSLGDAFRCAGCPYRGLPAFEAGKKITLTSDFLTADA